MCVSVCVCVCVDQFSPELFNATRVFLCSLPRPFSQQVLRCWGNARCTSSRLHEWVVLPCLLGCPGEIDSVRHYIVCTRLWSVVSSIDFFNESLGMLDALALSRREFLLRFALLP